MSKKQALTALLNKQLYAQNPHLALLDVTDTQLVAPILEHFVKNLQYVTPHVGEDYFTDAEKAMFYSALYSELRANIKDGERGYKGDKGDQGIQGQSGRDGATPLRGKDYFTQKDVEMIIQRVLALVPKPEAPKEVDMGAVVAPHLEEFKKNLPNNDSILVSILKDPRLRMLLHGGSPRLVAGSGITITTNADGTVTFTSTGGGTGTTAIESPTSGNIDGSNLVFVFTHNPIYILVDGIAKYVTSDYTVVGTYTVTLLADNAPTRSIRSVYSA